MRIEAPFFGLFIMQLLQSQESISPRLCNEWLRNEWLRNKWLFKM